MPRREKSMVPDAEFTSYYGLPVIKAPVWKRREIAGYFFLGGLAGASSVFAAGAQLTGRRTLSIRLKLVSTGAAALGGALLVHDLGRPSRFYNMLRVFKPTSPMSVGSWLLAAFGPASGLASISALTDRLPRVGALATLSAGAMGPAVSTYTAALVSDTAVPAWHDAYREMPFLFAGSSAIAAAGAGLVVAPADEAAAARRLAFIGSAISYLATEELELRLGMVADPYKHGRAGLLIRLGQAASVAGLGLAVFGRHHRVMSAIGGAALLSGSALTRFGIFEAGLQSAADPKYTVVPQRERLAKHEG